MDWYTISILIFIVILALIVYKDRKNFTRESILLLRKTKRGRNFLVWLGTRFPRLWFVVGGIAVAVGFVFSIFIFLLLIQNIISMLTAPVAVPGLAIPIPWPTTEASLAVVFFVVPFWYWIISIGVIALVHEGFHGIMFARERLKIKSMGFGLLAVIPLAFVEPNEKELSKKKRGQKLRIFSAGSFANIVVALICLFVLAYGFNPLFNSNGVGYQALIKDYPAAQVNMTGVIVQINGHEIRDTIDLENVLSTIGPGETITILTTNGTEEKTFVLKTAGEPEPEFEPDIFTGIVAGLEHYIPGSIEQSKLVSLSFSFLTAQAPEINYNTIKMEIEYWKYIKDNYPALRIKANENIDRLEIMIQDYPRDGFIGIAGVFTVRELKEEFEPYIDGIEFSYGLFLFLFMFNLGVGAVNLLPVKPFDGGRMWEIVFQRFVPKHSKQIMHYLAWATLILILINFAIPTINFLSQFLP